MAEHVTEHVSEHVAEHVSEHVALLRRAGYMRGASRAHGFYRALVLALTVTYLTQECVYAYGSRGDMAELSRVMFLLLCHVTAIAKQIVFHVDADRIDELTRSFHDDHASCRPPAARRLAARSVSASRRVLRAYVGCAVATCTLWLALAALRRASSRTVRFPFWTGLPTDAPPVFAAVLLYSFYVTTLVAVANTTTDAFIAAILYRCKTELTILRDDFRCLLERTARYRPRSHTLSRRAREAALMALFVEYFGRYQRVWRAAALLQDIFGGAILVQFAIGGWILCMAAYQLASLHVPSGEFASMVLFLACILTELFLYCYYGNELTVESERVAFSAYSMHWVSAPRRLRRCLLLLLLRARRPLRPAAGHVVPLSLDTFVRILKSSYTFYAVLRQTK